MLVCVQKAKRIVKCVGIFTATDTCSLVAHQDTYFSLTTFSHSIELWLYTAESLYFTSAMSFACSNSFSFQDLS